MTKHNRTALLTVVNWPPFVSVKIQINTVPTVSSSIVTKLVLHHVVATSCAIKVATETEFMEAKLKNWQFFCLPSNSLTTFDYMQQTSRLNLVAWLGI